MHNKYNIEKWVNALRSGEYTKIKGYLKKALDNDGNCGHCCLGVAADIFAKEFPEHEDVVSGLIFKGGYLSPIVQKWLGVESNNPEISKPVTIKSRRPISLDEWTYQINMAPVWQMPMDTDVPPQYLVTPEMIRKAAMPEEVVKLAPGLVTVLNDKTETTFEEMADMIEDKYLPENKFPKVKFDDLLKTIKPKQLA